jgi:hypothetical protein
MILLIALLALTGCVPVPVVIWTDRAEVAPIVESYNVSQDAHVAELHYVPELDHVLRLAEEPPDVAIAADMSDEGTLRLFQSLDRFFSHTISHELFYAALLEGGMREEHQLLIPVAFNLPLVYFSTGLVNTGDHVFISADEVRALGAAINSSSGDRWTRLGYSPRWEGGFAYQYARASGLTVTEGADGVPQWEFEGLLSFLNAASQWIDETNGGLEADVAFEERYLYAPQIELVREGRVGLGYERSDRFLGLSDERRVGLDFLWLGDGSSIHVLEDVVYAGIPHGARSRQGAEHFLSWLFQVETQVEVINSTIAKRSGFLGIAGGFSSLWPVNERYLEQFFPELQGKIVTAEYLSFPVDVPRHWDELLDEVVEGWLLREMSGRPQARDLESSVRAWLLQQED